MLIAKKIRALIRTKGGNVAILFGLSMIPLMFVVGSAIDYSTALGRRSQLQGAIDSAVLAGVAQTGATRTTVANNVFNASMANLSGTESAASFSTAADGSLSGSATDDVPTAFMQIAHIDHITVGVSATATMAPPAQGACIVGEANGMPVSQSAFTLNGAPNMNLQGCGAQSDASMNCNGHGGQATNSMAVGTVSGCSNPESSAPSFSDIYRPLASNITKSCGSIATGVTWSVGAIPPTGPSFFLIAKDGYTEYHVCGNLNLLGSGSLIPTGQSAVIVVENGSVNLPSKANIQTSLTTLVLTGTNTGSHTINFPNGKGNLASLTLSPPTDPINPWHGVSLYVDPALTTGVDETLGPGASMTFDGVAYMPKTNLTLSGSTSSGAGACSELVTSTFSTNGAASIAFQQSLSACNALNVPQAEIPYLKS